MCVSIKKYISFVILYIQCLQLTTLVEGNRPTFAITAPKIIRPRADYNVIVSLHDVVDKTTVTCTLEKRHNGVEKNMKEKIFDANNETQIFNLKIDLEWGEGAYKLNVIGKGGIDFNETIEVQFLYKQFVMLVQSDKAIYKPGQNVLFRVMVLDDNLRPVTVKDISDMKIFIIDPLDNKLRLFSLKDSEVSEQSSLYGTNTFNYSKGVTNDMSFQLHNEVKLGSWIIQAVTQGQIQNYTIFVDNYQLPLANVTITLPEYITFKDPFLDLKIDCFYTFGKPVKGNVRLMISKIKDCSTTFDNSTIYTENFEINGQFSKKLNLQDTRLLNANCAEMRLNVTAVINDSLTESIYTNFEAFDLYHQDLRAQQLTKQNKFKPGKKIRQKVQVHSISGHKLDKNIIYEISCEAQLKSESGMKSTIALSINKNEEDIVCDFETKIETTEFFTQFILKGSDHGGNSILLNSSISSYKGCSSAYVQVMIQEPLKKTEVGEMTNLVVTSNEPIKQFIYYIVIRGSIVNATYYKLDEPTTGAVLLPVKLTREMVPEAIIAVFFSSPNTGTIVSDALTIQVTGLFHNEVKFDVKTPLVNVSQKAKLIIEAEPDSELFLLGVDEAVLALKQGNDIIEKRVLKELQYNVYGLDSASGFLQSGMTFASNAPKECGSSYYSETFDPDADETVNKKPDSTYVRKDFRETWMWERISLPHGQKRIGVLSKVPDSITSWRLTAFAIHDDAGLGLTRLPGHVTVFRPFFIKLNLPYSIKRNETSEIHVLVFNYLNKTSDIEISVLMNRTDEKSHLKFDGCLFKLTMKQNEIQTLTCNVTAHEIGTYEILAEASAKSESIIETDAELRKLLVIYEGFVQHRTKNVFFDLTIKDGPTTLDKISIKYPANYVKGSEMVFASATAELITTTWKNSLQNIVSKNSIEADFSEPKACCEQRITQYFPKVYWLDFLKSSKKDTPDQVALAEHAIQLAIDLLCFQDPNDGSFVSWTYYGDYQAPEMNNRIPTKVKSSVWQTAYTLQLLNHAKNYLPIDSNIITNAQKWLYFKQSDSGEWKEVDFEHQITVTTDPSAYLTSFVYIALNSSDIKYKTFDQKAEKYLEKLFPTLTHPYDIVITCYALTIAKNTLRDICYDKIMNMSLFDNGVRHWLGPNKIENLEISAYAMKILITRESYVHALEVFKFLISKQHQNGYFITSSEERNYLGNSLTTIICTEAMTQFIKTMNSYNPKEENMFIDFKVGQKKQTIHIKPENEILQLIQLSSNTTELNLSAVGYGRAIARIYWQYNTLEEEGNAFNISANRLRKRGDEYIILDVCTNYNFEDKVKNAIMEIDLPSGYKFDKGGMRNAPEIIDRIEPTNSDTHLNIYLREVNTTGVCIGIPAIQSHKVQNTKPVPLKVYANYDRNLYTTQHWDITNSS